MTEPRTCARCEAEIEHLRSDAIYCSDYCRFTSWVERHPEARRERAQRLATALRADSTGRTRSTRNGAHSERGVRIYFTPDDLDELRSLTVTASARLSRKVSDASERIERS
jgi:hypothetical protein